MMLLVVGVRVLNINHPTTKHTKVTYLCRDFWSNLTGFLFFILISLFCLFYNKLGFLSLQVWLPYKYRDLIIVIDIFWSLIINKLCVLRVILLFGFYSRKVRLVYHPWIKVYLNTLSRVLRQMASEILSRDEQTTRTDRTDRGTGPDWPHSVRSSVLAF